MHDDGNSNATSLSVLTGGTLVAADERDLITHRGAPKRLRSDPENIHEFTGRLRRRPKTTAPDTHPEADSRGRFPSDPSYAGSRRRQPRPGEWSAEE